MPLIFLIALGVLFPPLGYLMLTFLILMIALYLLMLAGTLLEKALRFVVGGLVDAWVWVWSDDRQAKKCPAERGSQSP